MAQHVSSWELCRNGTNDGLVNRAIAEVIKRLAFPPSKRHPAEGESATSFENAPSAGVWFSVDSMTELTGLAPEGLLSFILYNRLLFKQMTRPPGAFASEV